MSITNEDLFSRSLEMLMRGQIICEFVDEDAYEFLSDHNHFSQADEFVRRLGKAIRKTHDGNAFYLTYQHLDDTGVKSIIKRQFGETINEIEPLVRWMQMVRLARNMDKDIHPGDVIQESQILDPIENASELRDELDKLCRSKFLANNNTIPSKQIYAILNKLKEHGYFIQNGTRYIATGKWSHLYDVLEFIATHEQLSFEEDEAEQTMLEFE